MEVPFCLTGAAFFMLVGLSCGCGCESASPKNHLEKKSETVSTPLSVENEDAAFTKHQPSIRELVQNPFFTSGIVSPDGSLVAYTKAQMSLEKNSIEVLCIVYDRRTKTHHSVTTEGRISLPRWVGMRGLAMMKMTAQNGLQLFFHEDYRRSGRQISDIPGGIANYEPFQGRGFIALAARPLDLNRERREKYGDFIRVEEETYSSDIYYVGLESIQHSKNGESDTVGPADRLTQLLPQALKVNNFVASDRTGTLFLNCQEKDGAYFENETRHFMIRNLPIRPAVTELSLPKGSRILAVSPDGGRIIVAQREKVLKSYIQSNLALYELPSTAANSAERYTPPPPSIISRNFDHEAAQVSWTRSGITVLYWQESRQRIARLFEDGRWQAIELENLCPAGRFFANEDGLISFPGTTPSSLTEIYLASPDRNGHYGLEKIAGYDPDKFSWDLGRVESIRWNSADGVEIEGVLHKPSDFDPHRKYPLLFLIHGGPAASASLAPFDTGTGFIYPVIQLVNRGVLVLEPNYRGSRGRGRDFQKLNVDNLGIGDRWDIESAIDHLVSRGFVDESRIGSMGWSQGGYISAFLAMHSDRFKAVSAGAALSNWYVYYSGSDNRNDYPLTGDPYKDIELYNRTSPMSGIENAHTPVMFQHGENDPRVPLVSALEMFRALKHKGVQTELFVYPGKAHGWLSPKESYAQLVQNYRWFMHHFFDEPLDFLMDDEGRGI